MHLYESCIYFEYIDTRLEPKCQCATTFVFVSRARRYGKKYYLDNFKKLESELVKQYSLLM